MFPFPLSLLPHNNYCTASTLILKPDFAPLEGLPQALHVGIYAYGAKATFSLGGLSGIR